MATGKWAGFTDDDLKKIKDPPPCQNPKETNTSDLVQDESIESFKGLSDTSKDDTSDSDFETQKIPMRYKRNFKPKEANSSSLANNALRHSDDFKSNHELSDDSCLSSDTSRKDSECERVPEASTIDLELFEARQKRVEAENARRRALLSKAINEKKHQTEAEVMKLAKITQELNHLDSILSADVSILRDYIEKASFEFSEAEKQYLKAEKLFVEAKQNLYEKHQRKEQLTEHLCAIIEENENRKASKLVELMKQLEMEVLVDDLEPPQVQPILSKFCLLNNETYHCCSTLKPPSPNLNKSSSSQEISQNTDDQLPCDS